MASNSCYAFKHVELYNIGSGKKRVLKAPGGGSSDIFGTADSASTPRSIKNHMASNIFAAPSPVRSAATTNGSGRSNGNSHKNLFGDSPVQQQQSGKNRLPSNIPIGSDAPDSNGNLRENGYGPEKNGNSVNGETYQKPESVPPQVLKNKIPPGGFSQGLW